jgi:pimeloyl-ACP methyl ester carboxylesterase
VRSGFILAALLLTACAPTAEDGGRTSEVTLTECRLPGVPEPVQCGTFEVAEDPARPDGRRLTLKIVVVAATDRPVEPDPVFFLAGGPGQGASETVASVLGFLDRTRKHRDLVFVDQRGTGGSGKLECPPPDDLDLSARLEFENDARLLAECLSGLDADTTAYTTPRFIADLDAVRAAMGFPRINLYGGSYGTRAGLAYLAAHGDRVRSAVLDGLAPYEMKLFLTFGEDGKRALDRLFADCAADTPCASAFPDLETRFWTWLDELDEKSTTTLRDPRTGDRALDVLVERESVTSAIRGLLYSSEWASLLPFALDRAVSGDLQPLLGQALILGEGAEKGMALGLMLSVACAEDLPRITDADRAGLQSEPLLGTSLLDMMTEACSAWPVGDVPDSLFDPVRSDVPILLLSGAEDPVTPERWAQAAAKTLSNATLVTIPSTGHIAARGGCGDKLVRDFYEDPGADLDVARDCISDVRRDPFFVRASGPNP